MKVYNKEERDKNSSLQKITKRVKKYEAIGEKLKEKTRSNNAAIEYNKYIYSEMLEEYENEIGG
jgi:ppGpp synthetase/RelA/SpoT-type nucleotidyltranferase